MTTVYDGGIPPIRYVGHHPMKVEDNTVHVKTSGVTGVMKLLFCPQCQDVIKLDFVVRSCKCGKARGKYINHIYAKVTEGAEVICLHNSDVGHALAKKDYDNMITAWMVRYSRFDEDPHVEWVKEVD